jgi:probable rRNA maturation factor
VAGRVRPRRGRPRVDARRLARTAAQALAAVGRAGGYVEIALVDDDEIRRLNRTWRGVDRPTDVLAFPLEVPEAGGLVGQVVISVETAARQARALRVPLATELDLLVTHGVLHCVGWDDRDPGEARLMHERARAILAASGRRPGRLWRGLLRE